MKTGILHPGEMGISIAATMQNSGHEVSWVTQGRSADTRERATAHKLREVPDLAALCAAGRRAGQRLSAGRRHRGR